MVLHLLQSPERKTFLKCLSGNGRYLHQTRVPRKAGPLWFLSPMYRRSLAVQRARVDFLIQITMGLGCSHGFDDTVEPEASKLWFLVCVKWLICPDCTKQLIAAIPSYVIEGISCQFSFSSKEIQFAVPFMGWKHHAWNACSENMSQPIGLSPGICRIICGGKSLGLLS